MKILVVEDDPFKLNAIKRVVARFNEAGITVATSLRSAMVALEESGFDLVILDMAIPSHTSEVGAVGTYSQPVGGLDVLLFLFSHGRKERVAILTQYPTVEYDRRHVPIDQLASVLRKVGIQNVVSAIHFSEKEDWERALMATIGVQA